MRVEETLCTILKAHNINCYHTPPKNATLPYVVYDRIGSNPQIYPGYQEVNLALDVYGSSVEQVVVKLENLNELLQSMDTDESSLFTSVKQYNCIDNSDENDIVYTLYVKFLFKN